MKSDAAVLSVTADQLERLARLIRERPEAVESALTQLAGTLPGTPDPVYLPPADRFALLEETAASLGISLADLRILDYVVTVIHNAN